MTENAYLVGLRLAGKKVVVIGGGTVAQRRVPVLIAGGAQVHVVAIGGRRPGVGVAQVDHQPAGTQRFQQVRGGQRRRDADTGQQQGAQQSTDGSGHGMGLLCQASLTGSAPRGSTPAVMSPGVKAVTRAQPRRSSTD